MPRYAALFRAVNLPAYGELSMADLRALLERLGLRDVQTVLQSGNAAFSSPRAAGALETLIERELLARLRLASPVLVRGGPQLADVIAGNPFPSEAAADPGHLLVVFLKSAPPAENVDALRRAIAGPERIEATRNHLYAYYPAGVGTSKLTAALIERKLGTRGTGRNWNTVLKLNGLTGGEARGR
jgi:uncharacterized protein (DUF1697 family)